MNQEEEKLATGTEAKEIVQEEKKEIRYKKIDCEEGYLTDEVEIGNFKVYQRRDIAQNLMLGDYNETGDYVLSTTILKSLVNVRKEKTGDYGQTMFLTSLESFAEKGKLRFSLSVVPSKEESGQNLAVLKLLESVKKIDGYIENTNTFIVATYKDIGDELFEGKVAKIFNIVDPATDVGKDDPAVVSSIIERIKFLNRYHSFYLEDVEAQEQAYYYARLELLKDPKFESILNDFKKHLTKASLFIDPLAKDYYAKLNELLDIVIENASFKDKQLGVDISQTLKDVVQKHNTICEQKHEEYVKKASEAEKTPTSQKAIKEQQAKRKPGGQAFSKGGKSQSSGGGGGKSSGGSKPAPSKSNSKSTYVSTEFNVRRKTNPSLNAGLGNNQSNGRIPFELTDSHRSAEREQSR